MPAIADELRAVALGAGDDGAGGINDVEAAVFEFAHDAFADAVGGNGNASFLHGFGGGAANVSVDLIGARELADAARFKAAQRRGDCGRSRRRCRPGRWGVASDSMICTARRTPMQNPISLARMTVTMRCCRYPFGSSIGSDVLRG